MSAEEQHEAEFTVCNELGLHARPAGQFVTLADHFGAEITVCRGSDCVDGRSVLSLLSLAASCGTRLLVRGVGADAQEAGNALGDLLQNPQPPAKT